MTTIFDAIRKGDLAALKQSVLKAGTAQTDGDGWSPLELACVLVKEAEAKYLIDAGANVNFQDPKGATCLHQACFSDKNTLVIATALLEKGADLTLKNENGSLPIHFAAGKGNFGCVKLLCAFGTPLTPNKNGKDPIQLAREKEMHEIADFLEAYKAKGPAAISGGATSNGPCSKCAALQAENAALKAQLAAAQQKIAELEKQ